MPHSTIKLRTKPSIRQTMNILRRHFKVLAMMLSLMFSSQLVMAADEFRVIASIKPVHSILVSLMEGIEPPELLLSGDSTPFDYALKEPQILELQQANMVVWVGPELEKFLVEPLTSAGKNTYVMTLLDNPNLKILWSRWDESKRDPYFWLDSRNGIVLIDELTRALTRIDPGRSHLYKRNRDKLIARMALLDRKLEYGYRGLQAGRVLGYFDTQQYFEQAYALKIGESVVESPTSTTDASSLLTARKHLADGEYSCLLIENTLKTPSLGLLTDGIDIQIGKLDSLGTQLTAGSDLYFELMEYNTATIKDCFVRADSNMATISEPEPEIKSVNLGGRFMLTDHNNSLFTDKQLLGKYQLIFFGYTSCPDVCPTSLLIASQALKKLGTKSKQLQTYFISIDPARDTPDKMNKYVGYFSDDIVGLTGPTAMIDRVAGYYKVEFEKINDEDNNADTYAMDHTASFFLMAPDGQFITKFPFGITSVELVTRLEEIIR